MAEKVLDQVLVVGDRDILSGYNRALSEIPGWDKDSSKRTGRWYFVGYGGPGESGQHMLRLFREANRMGSAKFNNWFRDVTELPGLKLTAHDTVIFVDDFAGTGDQVTTYWPTIAELIASEARCFLILTAMTSVAASSISENTELTILSSYVLGPDKAVFHDENNTFTAQEREVLEGYCAKADGKKPRGYGNLGVLFVLSHKTPNNALPILYANHGEWRGLFPRYLDAA